jgi:hypothetical protein
VDATGDADVAARAGADIVFGREGDHLLQPGTMMFDMAGVDTGRVKQYMDDHPEDFEWASEFVALAPYSERLQHNHFVGQGFLKLVREGLDSGELYLGRDSILLLTTVHPGVLHFNSTRITGVDGTDAHSLTAAEIDARRQVESLSRFLIARIPGFENAYLAGSGSQVGIRETRHVLGEYVLQGEEVLRGKKFEDVVARGYFPVDIHNLKGKEGYVGGGHWLDLDDSYDIPMRSLIPRRIENLVIAGRPISATHEAHGSLRTQGGAMGIGHGAGAIAATAVRAGLEPRKVSHRDVQDLMTAQGATLWRDEQRVAEQYAAARNAIDEALRTGAVTGKYFPSDFTGKAPRL